ncbi:MAG: hypothetical protein OEW21_07535, partial [Betaproteobacteria bacterium]|nr:hypothetical protein [Betaproteobacteria bacterium]
FGLVLISVSVPMAAAGSVVPLLGLLIASIAPNAFLAGLAMVVFSMARGLTKRIGVATVATILITLLVGVNTRLPSVVSDASNRDHLEISRPWRGAVGQPLHIETSTSELRGRRFPYASVAPACYGDGCFVTRGFRGPYTGISRDYWRENVVDTVLAAGFSRASANEKAPRLVVSESRDGDLAAVTIELTDESGVLLARFQGTFRSGYALETKDSDAGEEVGALRGVLQYLMHGNSVSYWLSRSTRPPVESPLQSFLKAGASLSHPQAREPGNATPVALEILSEKLYEPAWIIKDHDDGTTKWADLSFDKPRHDRCTQLLKPEKAGTPLMQGWFLFTGDPTGRKKARYTGNVLCEAEVLWFFDYAAEHGKMVLTKYTAAGDLAYRISFDKPAPIYGFAGHIMSPTFKEQAGYLSFDWWDSNQAGNDRHIKRSMKVRLAEPKAPSSEAAPLRSNSAIERHARPSL